MRPRRARHPPMPRVRHTNIVDDVVELAIENAVAQGAAIEFCHDTQLERFGSIAAIERY